MNLDLETIVEEKGNLEESLISNISGRNSPSSNSRHSEYSNKFENIDLRMDKLEKGQEELKEDKFKEEIKASYEQVISLLNKLIEDNKALNSRLDKIEEKKIPIDNNVKYIPNALAGNTSDKMSIMSILSDSKLSRTFTNR